MPLTAILLKLAASAGIATVSELLKSDSFSQDGLPKALTSVLGGVATGFTQQYTGQIDYKSLTRFISQEGGIGYEELNHDIEKLMINSVPKAFGYLGATYEKVFGTDKQISRFFRLLEEQARERPNDEKDYRLMSSRQADWLAENVDYAWQFAEVFASDKKVDLEELDRDHLQKFIATHFQKSFDIVFLEGLKDPKDERPYKAFILKSLKGIEIQLDRLGESQERLLKTIEVFEANSSQYLEVGRVYLNEEWQAGDYLFKKETSETLRELLRLHREAYEHNLAVKEDTGVIREDTGAIREGMKILADKVAPIYPKFLTATVGKFEAGQYVERGLFLEELRADLLKDKDSILVNGLGGVGKSTLAAAYVKRYEEDYDHIAWLEQTDTFEAMLLSQTSLLENLEITPEGIAGAELPRVIFQKMAAVPGKRKLLVLDNVDETLTAQKDLLPAGYHILLTSRERLRIGFSVKEVGKLDREEASELIRKCLTRMKPGVEEIKAFCEQVDYHALTIELLAKTLEVSLELKSLTELTEHLRSNRWDAAVLQEDVFTTHGRAETQVYQHLLASFTLAKLDDEEKWTLLQLAVLPPLAQDVEDLSAWIGVGKPSLGKTLKTLERKGWIHRTGNAFVMHRMVQVLVGHQVPPNEENVRALLDTFTGKLSIDQTKDNPVDKFQWIPHGRLLFERLETSPLKSPIAVLANNLALVLNDLGDYAGARALLEKALASVEKNFGEAHPNTARTYSNLALVLNALGDYEVARALLEKALASDEKNFGEAHPTTAVSYFNLASVLKELGDYEGARALLEKAKTSAEKNYGEAHPTTARTYSNLALVLRDLGDYEGARALLEKAKTSVEKNFGEAHPNTARTYSNLALVLNALGDYEVARALLEKALASDEKNFGEAHPTTAVSYSNLAIVLQDLGDYEGARALLEKAKTSAEKSFGEGHSTTAMSYSNLAIVLQDLGDYAGARALLEKALASDEKNFGEAHPSTAVSYSNLAIVLQDLGDYEVARALLEKAKASAEKNFGEAHPSTARMYSNLATVLKYLGDYEGARALLEKALASDEKNFGEGHPDTAVSYSNLATILQDLGDYEGARALLEKALASDEKNFGEAHPATAVRYSNLAMVLKELGDSAGARALLEKALASDEKNFGEAHPTTAVKYLNFGVLLDTLGVPCEGLSYVKKAHAVFSQFLGSDHPNAKTALSWVEPLSSKCSAGGAE